LFPFYNRMLYQNAWKPFCSIFKYFNLHTFVLNLNRFASRLRPVSMVHEQCQSSWEYANILRWGVFGSVHQHSQVSTLVQSVFQIENQYEISYFDDIIICKEWVIFTILSSYISFDMTWIRILWVMSSYD